MGIVMKSLKVGLDLGHNCTKITDDCGQSSMVESRVRLGSVNVISADGDTAAGLTVLSDQNGNKYTVGKITDFQKLNPDEFATSQIAAALANYAILNHLKTSKHRRFEDITGQLTVFVCTAIPFGRYFNKDGSVNIELIEKVKENLEQPIEIEVSPGKTIQFKLKVVVKSQTQIAYFSHVFYDEQKPNKPANQRTLKMFDDRASESVALIDLGGGTSDVVSINELQQIEIDKSGSLNIGSNTLSEELTKLICKHLKIEFIKHKEIDRALTCNQVKLGKQLIDVSHLVDEAYKQIGQQILTFLKNRLGNTDSIDTISFFGGFSKDEKIKEQIKGNLRSSFSDNEVWLEDPQFENSKALSMFCRFKHSW